MGADQAGRELQELCGAAAMSWLASLATAASGVAARVKSAASARLEEWVARGSRGHARHLSGPSYIHSSASHGGQALWTRTHSSPTTLTLD